MHEWTDIHVISNSTLDKVTGSKTYIKNVWLVSMCIGNVCNVRTPHMYWKRILEYYARNRICSWNAIGEMLCRMWLECQIE